MGRFGFEITKALYNYGYEVLAVDMDDEKIHEVSNFSTHAIVADDRKKARCARLR